LASRLELWPRALQMIHDTPYTGVGLNLFPQIMNRFYPGFVLGPQPHAHNLLLQTGVDLGIAGLVALVWLIWAFLAGLGRAYSQTGDRWTKAMALAMTAGMVSFLCFGTIDTVTLGAKPGIGLWIMLGLGESLWR